MSNPNISSFGSSGILSSSIEKKKTNIKITNLKNSLFNKKSNEKSLSKSVNNSISFKTPNTQVFTNSKNNTNENIPVIVQTIQNGQFTTNIQNNLNINIGSHPQKRNLFSSDGKLLSKGETASKYLESIKGIFENKSMIKLKEELLESKMRADKLQNENKLLQEKLKTMKVMVSFNENKAEMIKKQYQEILEVYKKKEVSLNNNKGFTKIEEKKINSLTNSRIENKMPRQDDGYIKIIEKVESFDNIKPEKEIENLLNSFEPQPSAFQQSHIQNCFTSTLNILLDILELFILQKPSYTTRDSVLRTNTENISYSIDIYDSYNNDDDRRVTLVEQIQSIVLTKLKFLSAALNLNLEKEISKVKNWNNYMNSNNNISNLSLSNISQVRHSIKKETIKEKDAISNTSSDQNSSNIFQNSPKFFRNLSFDSLKDNTDSNFRLKVFECKDENFMRLNTSAQNDSLDLIGETQFNNSFQDFGNTNNKNIKILGSFGNLNIENNINNENTFENKSSYSSNSSSLKEKSSMNKDSMPLIKIIDPEIISHSHYQGQELLIEKEKEKDSFEIIKKDYQNQNMQYQSLNDSENKIKFNSTFKKLSIDLNDEPTDFNLEEICVNPNEVLNKSYKDGDSHVILSPIVL